ncbi:MAG: Maf family protein [Verrucomicrobiota bacterium]
MPPPFVLASASPRRRQLLENAGYQFDVVTAATEEIFTAALTIRELTICNATRKALAIARAIPDAVILGADTLVGLDGIVIGKPADLVAAAKILRRLSGRVHEVCTAVFVCDFARGRTESLHEISRVHFRTLTDQAIAGYFEKINPLDKAGAYAAQGHGFDIIERIDGSYSNVIGLPMEKTARALRAFGIIGSPPSPAPRLSAHDGVRVSTRDTKTRR